MVGLSLFHRLQTGLHSGVLCHQKGGNLRRVEKLLFSTSKAVNHLLLVSTFVFSERFCELTWWKHLGEDHTTQISSSSTAASW